MKLNIEIVIDDTVALQVLRKLATEKFYAEDICKLEGSDIFNG
jgi:hypothetical protein